MKKMPLGKRKDRFALVDDTDYQWLSQWKWRCWIHHQNKVMYACREYIDNGKLKRIWMHKEIMKPEKGMLVDHKDHNTLNNQRNNLRICTQGQNNMNKARLKLNKTSKYKGVHYVKLDQEKRWRAMIGFENKRRNIGYFSTEKEAAIAYNNKAVELFGEFAYLNVIQ